MFTDEQEKYLTITLGKGFNCDVSKTPPKIVQQFKDFNAWMKNEMHQEPIVHFV